MSTDLKPTAASNTISSIIDLIRKADKAKPSAAERAAFETLLREHPAVWRVAGDIMRIASDKLVQDMESSYTTRKSLMAGKAQLESDLARPGEGELERLLIQQVILTWLKLAYTEYHHEHYLIDGNTTIKVADFWERRLSAAQRRYLRACETLTRVRRLQLPAVQVNIAEQQVNQLNTKG